MREDVVGIFTPSKLCIFRQEVCRISSIPTTFAKQNKTKKHFLQKTFKEAILVTQKNAPRALRIYICICRS